MWRRVWTTSVSLLLGMTAFAANEEPTVLLGKESVDSRRVGRFDIQGIRLGMPITQIASILSAKGYSRERDGGSYIAFVASSSHDHRVMRVYESFVSGEKVAYRIDYVQSYPNGYDKETIKSQVIEKFGSPNAIAPFGDSEILHYFDSRKSINDLSSDAKKQCYSEVLASGKSSLQANSGSGSAQPYLWALHGDQQIRENCPNTLPLFLEAVNAWYAPEMRVSIGRELSSGPMRLTAPAWSLTLSSKALQNDSALATRRAARERRNAAPPAKADL